MFNMPNLLHRLYLFHMLSMLNVINLLLNLFNFIRIFPWLILLCILVLILPLLIAYIFFFIFFFHRHIIIQMFLLFFILIVRILSSILILSFGLLSFILTVLHYLFVLVVFRLLFLLSIYFYRIVYQIVLVVRHMIQYYNFIRLQMGCLCPRKGSSDNEYHIMTSDDAKSHTGYDEIDKNCQRIDIEDDDYFEKSNMKTTISRAQTKKYISITDFTTVKILGRGGFGKVLLVEKKDDGKLFAMKVIKKDMVAQRNQKIHTLAERKILENMRSPFIVQLHYAFQSESRLYLVMDFMIGGELFFHLRREKRFSVEKTRLYAAQIILALEYLHKKNIIYRDLKPENILVGADGYLKITDFGLSKVVMVGEKSYTFCGTPEYLAPEIYQNKGHDADCDWWSLGALIYQMLSGAPPFYSKNKQQMLEARLTKSIVMKEYFTPDTVSLLRGLLNNNPKQRLGHNGADQIKRHAFFSELDWKLLTAKKIQMPFKPKVQDGKDTEHFDKVFTDEAIKETPTKQLGDDYDGYTYQYKKLGRDSQMPS